MSVVAMLEGSPEVDSATTRSAHAVAQLLRRPLTGLCALPDPLSALMVVSTPEMAGLSPAATQTVIELQKELLTAAEAAFRKTAAECGEGVSARFVHEVATTETASAGAATLADALVFPRGAAKAGEPLSLAFDHVMMDARLPLILAGTAAFKRGPVIIGWDGSNGAARAVRLHADLLAAMGEVIVARNQKDAERSGVRPGSGADELEAWLQARGIKTRIEGLDTDVGTSLLQLAGRTGATLIVAGAYGHSRLGERLFGGTSRRLLEAKGAPALALAR
jgi:nucleotide-binding universal stress UspA family protein